MTRAAKASKPARKQTNFRLPEDVIEYIRVMAEQSGKTQTRILEECIRMHRAMKQAV